MEKFNEKIVHNFLVFTHDAEEDHITPSLYKMIYSEKNESPGFALYLETQISKTHPAQNVK